MPILCRLHTVHHYSNNFNGLCLQISYENAFDMQIQNIELRQLYNTLLLFILSAERLEYKQYDLSCEDLQAHQLAELLREFYTSARKQDGKL